MRKLMGWLAAAAATASLAMAAGLAGFYGNTLVIKDGAGKELARTQFKEDGTYSTQRGNATVKGKWRLDGALICTTEDGSDEEECVDLQVSGKTKGQSWKVTSNGLNLSLSLE